jgi:poly-gamma-glutamate capsule biosynthesis protein CapA/YwtB (metallophosphatase superfamily)
MRNGLVRLFLCGDVMLGRGIDQILPHPGDPTLQEPGIGDARTYVALAEQANGPIPRPVPFPWPWGEALGVLQAAAPDVRVVNLETSITQRGEPAAGKVVCYRMHPANLPCLATARPHVCVLANNHVLDFGREGLAESLDALATAGLATAGAGRDLAAAQQPAPVDVKGDGRVAVVAFGTTSSGIPPSWAATPARSGVDLVGELSAAQAAKIAARVRQTTRASDLVVASIHWGSNWGYEVAAEQVGFAHGLIDGGIDVVYGHSSHHPRPVEVYRGKLILYGCGDFINDYEGITSHTAYRHDLRLGYFAAVKAGSGDLEDLWMMPLQAWRLRLQRASHTDAAWLQAVLDRESRRFGTRVELRQDGMLALRWT